MMLLILVRIIDMRKFLILFLFVTLGASAQELDSLATDSLIKEPPKHLVGGYFLIGFNQSPGPTGSNTLANFGIGMRYDKYEGGAIFSFVQDEYEKRLVFPNFFRLAYAHGGAYFAYHLIESKYINVAPQLSFQLGDLVWERLDTKEDFAREKFSLWQIGAKIETPFLRYVRPELILGYQSMSEIIIPELESQNFTGFFVGFNVKVGYFNQ